MGKNKIKNKEPMIVPMEFSISDDGAMRIIIHVTDLFALPQILRDIGNHTPEIIEALSEQLAAFINEKKESENSDQ